MARSDRREEGDGRNQLDRFGERLRSPDAVGLSFTSVLSSRVSELFRAIFAFRVLECNMTSSNTNLCFICSDSLSVGETRVVKEKGIQTLSEASVKRKLPNHQRLLKDLNKVTAHNDCYKSYINRRMIEAYVRRSSQERQTKPKLRSEGHVSALKVGVFCVQKR